MQEPRYLNASQKHSKFNHEFTADADDQPAGSGEQSGTSEFNNSPLD